MTPIGSLELGRFPYDRAYASLAPPHQLTPDLPEKLGFSAIPVAGSPEEDSETPITRWSPWEAEESSLDNLWHRRLIFRPDEVTTLQRASSFRPQRFSSRRTGRSGRALGPCPFFR